MAVKTINFEDAILLAFNPDSDAEALSSQITGAVSGFQKRQAEKRRLREQQELDKKATEEFGAE